MVTVGRLLANSRGKINLQLKALKIYYSERLNTIAVKRIDDKKSTKLEL